MSNAGEAHTDEQRLDKAKAVGANPITGTKVYGGVAEPGLLHRS